MTEKSINLAPPNSGLIKHRFMAKQLLAYAIERMGGWP
jgi:hypothetical protein